MSMGFPLPSITEKPSAFPEAGAKANLGAKSGDCAYREKGAGDGMG